MAHITMSHYGLFRRHMVGDELLDSKVPIYSTVLAQRPTAVCICPCSRMFPLKKYSIAGKYSEQIFIHFTFQQKSTASLLVIENTRRTKLQHTMWHNVGPLTPALPCNSVQATHPIFLRVPTVEPHCGKISRGHLCTLGAIACTALSGSHKICAEAST